MAKYSQTTYWEQRYLEDGEPFDWHVRYANLKPLFNRFIAKTANTLSLGCGTSELEPQMREDGYEAVVCVDSSSAAVVLMAKRYHEYERLAYHCMDARALSFGSESFDAVIEKALVDALMCAAPGDVSSVAQLVGEAHRVLRPGGVLLSITHASEADRLPLMQHVPWRMQSSETVSGDDGAPGDREGEYTILIFKK